ncbi:sensor histidine kinase [Nocardia jejuensis]|uniref:sensor histidine kinase n=1 Tax=Nocardia jejuensis TaxID=328049 RepID=UPI0008321DDE|nr:histidine kinase [Nocardia jejuensis]
MVPALAPTRLTRLLRLVGLVSVVVTSIHAGMPGQPWAVVLAAVSWIGWAGWTISPAGPSRIERISLCAMAVGGGATCVQVAGSAITAFATVFVAFALSSESLRAGISVAALTLTCMFGSSVAAGMRAQAILGLLAGAVVVGLMGWSRRQNRVTAEQNRLLVEQSRVIRAERDRAAALAERGRIARDMHDVLAHTLGGLVLQLDAADALFEAGETERAADRVKASHALAVSGLAEARGVVDALRADGFDLTTELRRLADEHRDAGERVDLDTDGDLELTDEQVAVAIARAAREALTNARKHAPGQPVTLALRSDADVIRMRVSNPLSARRGSLAESGSGAGLLGMRERMAAVGGSVDARKEQGRWTVRIRVPRR